MLYLLIAVFAGSCKGFCGKKISGSVTGIYDSIAMSVIRMFFCCVIGFSVAAMQGGSFSITPVKGGIYLLSGISMAVFLISWLLAVRGGAFMLINAFTTASFLVTTIFGFAVFKERITLKQIVGMLFIVAAIILLIKYNNRIKAKMSVKDFLMLLVVLVSQGLTNVSQKMFTAWVPDGSNAVFNFYTFLITFVLLAVWFACMSVKNAGPAVQTQKYCWIYRSYGGYAVFELLFSHSGNQAYAVSRFVSSEQCAFAHDGNRYGGGVF